MVGGCWLGWGGGWVLGRLGCGWVLVRMEWWVGVG